MIKHQLTTHGDKQELTVFVNGELQSATNEHPNWKAILQAVIVDQTDDESAVERLFDVGKAVKDRFEKVSERVTVQNGHILLDGDVVDNSLTKQVVRFLDENVADWKPLVAFLERVVLNPQTHARDQLYTWLARHDFSITDDGRFVAYKGVQADGKYSSIMNGPGVVDGQPVQHVTNAPGSVVEIARSKVQHDPRVGCASGLHAGTWSYARGFGAVVVKVLVDPRDVVSVPTDCDAQKIRTCRYTVVEEVSAPTAGVLATVTGGDEEEAVEFDSFQANSSWIDRVEWDGDEETVTVYLDNGKWYTHSAPYSVFKAFKNAASAGTFYNTEFKDKYTVTQDGDGGSDTSHSYVDDDICLDCEGAGCSWCDYTGSAY